MIIGMSGTPWLKRVGAWDAILIALGERSSQALGPLLMFAVGGGLSVDDGDERSLR